MGVATYRRALQSVQRKIALRISRAYVTVSYEAATTLAPLIPIHLLAEEKRRVWGSQAPRGEASKVEREVTMGKWQDEWSRGTKGAWTRTLIPNISPWINRKHGRTSYHLTQALTGYGSFRSYTNKIGKATSDLCLLCGEVDTPEHTLFLCPRAIRAWEARRGAINNAEDIGAQNMIRVMLISDASWKAVDEVVVGIMIEKEEEERRQERQKQS